MIEFKENKSRTAPLFIIEGPDACGKTTFAKTLARAVGGVYWHLTCTKLLAPAMKDYQMNALENVKANNDLGRPVVLDRHWPSEQCYGDYFRPDSGIDIESIRAEAEKFTPIYVFCMDEDGADSAAKRHESHLDPAHPYSREDYMNVYKGYEKLIKRLSSETGKKVLVIGTRNFRQTENLTADQVFIQDLLEAYQAHC